MEVLYDRLGFNSIANTICNTTDKKQFIILGKYKQGKTTLLNVIQEQLKITYPQKYILKLSVNPDSILGVADYAPFTQFIKYNKNISREQTSLASEIVLKNSNRFAKTFIELINMPDTYPTVYNNTEKSILDDLKRISSGNGVFICDDVDKWDWMSKALLKKLITEVDCNWISNSTFIIAATNKEDSYDFLDINERRDRHYVFRLTDLSDADVKEYLERINSRIDYKELYSITGGNFGETVEFAKYFNQPNNKVIYNNIQEYLQDKINTQIANDNNQNGVDIDYATNQTVEMINCSSIVGERFQRALLKELIEEENSFNNLVSYTLKSGIYGQKRTELYFSYNHIYRRLNEYNQNCIRYHNMFSKALQKITPSNFAMRAKELLLTDSQDAAAILYFNYIINRIRKYRKSVNIESQYVRLLSEQELYQPLLNMIKAYDYYFSGDYDAASKVLPNRQFIVEIDCQIDYLRCLILVNKDIVSSNYRDAASILNTWAQNRYLQSSEPFIWIQFAILYDEIMSELGCAAQYNEKIHYTFATYSAVDVDFRIEYYDFLSKNNYTYVIDNQYDQTKQAVDFFVNCDYIPGKSLCLRALTNHIGNAIVMGKYTEASDLSKMCFDIIDKYNETRHFLPDVINNYIISIILSNSAQVSKSLLLDFIKCFEALISNISSDEISRILLKINYGLVLFLADKDNCALKLYKELFDLIKNESGIDDYYRYFIINNYMLLSGYINKNLDSVSLVSLENLNPYPSNAQFFKKHTEIVQVQKKSFSSKQDLFTQMGDCILGKAWTFWGRPLLFTDIQYWSD
ncbi:MAG: hypothetical protein HDT28_01385 [Clostridiales bacterium]|nr:hypothetical protein [Clostridiales bacterium]